MKVPKIFQFKRTKRFNATTVARRAPVMDEYEEPQTKLSSAFVVVLVLHLVAVGGIYAFNSIKANRKVQEPLAHLPTLPTTVPTAPVVAPAPVHPVVARQPENPDSAFASNLTPGRSKPVPAVIKKPEEPVRTSSSAKGATSTYKVSKGDNPVVIAKRLGVSYDELLKLNGIDDPKKLQIGQVLKIPAKKN